MRASMLTDAAALTEDEKLAQLRERDETHALAKRKQLEMAKFASALGVKNAVRAASAAPVILAASLPRRIVLRGQASFHPHFLGTTSEKQKRTPGNKIAHPAGGGRGV